MNVSSLLDDGMSLEEKLKAIADAMEQAQTEANEKAKSTGGIAALIDPADFTQCEGCQ